MSINFVYPKVSGPGMVPEWKYYLLFPFSEVRQPPREKERHTLPQLDLHGLQCDRSPALFRPENFGDEIGSLVLRQRADRDLVDEVHGDRSPLVGLADRKPNLTLARVVLALRLEGLALAA